MRAVVLVALVAGSAHAEVTLEQTAGVCSLDTVRSELDALRSPGRDGTVRLHTWRHADRVEALVTIGEDTRSVTARDCNELAKSVALIIAMTLRDAPAPPTAVTTPLAPLAIESLPPIPLPVSLRARPWQFALLVGGAGDLRGHPSLVSGVRARRGWWSLGVELRVETENTIDIENGGQIVTSRTYGTATPCVHVSRFGLCGLVAGGALRGRGMELRDAAQVARPIVQLGARVEWSYPVAAPIALRVHVDATQALTSSRFLVDQMPVWTSDSREIWLGAGVVANFP